MAESDLGLGTIVGSAVYNVLMNLAVCGLFAGMVRYHTLRVWSLRWDGTL